MRGSSHISTGPCQLPLPQGISRLGPLLSKGLFFLVVRLGLLSIPPGPLQDLQSPECFFRIQAASPHLFFPLPAFHPPHNPSSPTTSLLFIIISCPSLQRVPFKATPDNPPAADSSPRHCRPDSQTHYSSPAAVASPHPAVCRLVCDRKRS